MEGIWTTIGTILATGIVLYGGHFLTDYLQGKREIKKQELEKEREIRDARRKYREHDVAPIKESLTKLGSDLEWANLKRAIQKFIDEHPSLGDNELQTFKKTKESIEDIIKTTPIKILTDIIPLINIVTSEDAKQALRDVFFEYTILAQPTRKNVSASKDVKDKLDLAYKKLEDYVSLAD